MAKPSVYTPEIAKEILERLATGETLRAICRDEDMPAPSTVRDWVRLDREGFRSPYLEARDHGLEEIAEELFEIADDGKNDWMERELEGGRIVELPDHEHINRSRLRVDARKWYLSKLAPKKYGDATTLKHADPDGNKLTVELIRVPGKPE